MAEQSFITISARIPATLENGKPYNVIEQFACWSIPLYMQHIIVEADDPIAKYKQYVQKSKIIDRNYFDLNPQRVSLSEAHIHVLDHWIQDHNGWDIQVKLITEIV